VIAAVPSIHPVPKEQQTNSFPSPQSQQNRDRDEVDLTPVPIEAVVHQGAGKVEQQIERLVLPWHKCDDVRSVRKSEPAPKPKTPALEEVQAPENNVPKQPSPEVTHVFLDSDETPSVETSQVPEPRLSDEERDLIERQKQWDQADLAASASRLGLLSAALIGAFFL
ncbi:hypothetical protein OSTOST_11514, partial [Ostertagia ostertagi]